MADYLANPEEAKEYSYRYKFLYIVIVLITLVYFIRLWYLQIYKGNEFRFFSDRNRIKIEKLPAPRGMILDREGRILVDNEPGFDVFITPQYVDDLSSTADVVSKIINVSPNNIIQKVRTERKKNGAFRPVLVKENLTRDEVARLERLRIDYPGLDVNMSIKRFYTLGQDGAHLFGYVGEISKEELPKINRNLSPSEYFEQGDIIGKSGLELALDHELRGGSGQSFVQVDAHGRKIETLSVPHVIGEINISRDAEPGETIMLTIDKDIQEAAFKALNGNDKIGGVVALNPKNGEILAWVSSPSYDPSEFSKGISSKLWSALINDPYKPLLNKIIQEHQPPGSTLKALVAIAGLQEKVININSTVFCPGFIQFGGRQVHCHLQRGHGYVNVVQALERSCDVFFYKLGMQMGIDTLAKYARAMGLGAKTGIGLNNEVPGLVPTTEWKKRTLGEEWQPGETLSNFIGQGFFLTTPLQMAFAYSGIANEGPAYQPYLVKKIFNINGTTISEAQPQIKIDPSKPGAEVQIDNNVYKIVKKGLWSVPNGAHGTATSVKIPGVEVAGKTGTVQLFTLSADEVYKKCINRPMHQRHHGWFLSYAPADDPQIVVAVFAEHGCSGSGGAAPVAKEVLTAYAQKYLKDRIEKFKSKKSKDSQPIQENQNETTPD